MIGLHTPGPWHFFPSEDGFPRVYIGGEFPEKRELHGPYIIVNGAEPRADMDVHEANARLIAAAPALEEALQGAVEALAMCQPRTEHGAACQHVAILAGLAALAEARGAA